MVFLKTHILSLYSFIRSRIYSRYQNLVNFNYHDGEKMRHERNDNKTFAVVSLTFIINVINLQLHFVSCELLELKLRLSQGNVVIV